VVNYLSMTEHGISRRAVIAGAASVGIGVGIGTLSACADEGAEPGQSTPEPVTVPVASVPVGAVTIAGQVIVTQRAEGEFVAFSAVCTHEHCLISRVEADTVVCTCHGSTFSSVDGAVVKGPAQRPLDPRSVTSDGENLTIS
jgi:nitrite reductase/ring-hydroxylating ferredoxin subunit